MKVKTIINYIVKANDILKCYEDKSVEYMLDDIYKKISEASLDSKKMLFEPNEVITKISKEMGKDEVYNFIKDFNKNQLLEIAKIANIRIEKNGTKTIIAELIANHFGFLYLDSQIANRFSKTNTTELSSIAKME